MSLALRVVTGIRSFTSPSNSDTFSEKDDSIDASDVTLSFNPERSVLPHGTKGAGEE